MKYKPNSDFPILDDLRDTLRKIEAYPTPGTSRLAELRRILREAIAQLEAAQSHPPEQ